jgi:hypothetical protein
VGEDEEEDDEAVDEERLCNAINDLKIWLNVEWFKVMIV